MFTTRSAFLIAWNWRCSPSITACWPRLPPLPPPPAPPLTDQNLSPRAKSRSNVFRFRLRGIFVRALQQLVDDGDQFFRIHRLLQIQIRQRLGRLKSFGDIAGDHDYRHGGMVLRRLHHLAAVAIAQAPVGDYRFVAAL